MVTFAERISMLQEANLDKNQQSSVNRCLSKIGHAPSRKDIAICINESKRNKKSESKMTEKEADWIIKKDRKVVSWITRKETSGTGFKTLPVKKSKYVKTKDD